MCGRYSCALHEETILNEARVRPENWVGREAYRPSYNVGPSRSQPVLIATKGKTATEPSDESHRRTTDEDGGGDGGLDHDSSYTGTHRELHAMRWGLWPRWSKTQDEAYKSSFRTINARSESVQEKVMFKGLVDTRRCVVLCEGYGGWVVSMAPYIECVYLHTVHMIVLHEYMK
ncbi:hypothetical protein SARC_03660 [Sphaeroforma arctica JP610]|uniref:Uncharacterized protein n=1 Tax=Sphaeroforma arctica JP610 TaxID=667725 RepID=A0A0L0G5N0_9EUKA|nr:hypothetical protein SARC_03660 [Sphaeroforma arctica JP610]KNC84116.1 hypothetical protein SARC_03660 [Sphaeroforma arctica JP610]|eukprot:XP_014158018.1 hypothetical protein SARC_03660 [Sphaeroforma arctica JP610]